jgi:hypothetical protein
METYRKHEGDWETTGSSDRVFQKISFLPSRRQDKPQKSVNFSREKDYE